MSVESMSGHARTGRSSGWFALLLVFCLALAGCKESLYSNLNEQEANEMLVVLAQTGIDSQKSRVSDEEWSISVNQQDLPVAIEALKRAGLPRTRFANLGDMFKRDGIVSTPTEERVRFLYGVSQELSNTLSKIDGVTAARVHIVIPENDPLADRALPSSASVFIKHDASLDLHPMLPSIKSLVLRSVEGLTFDTVYVSLFPTSPVLQERISRAGTPLFGVRLPAEQADWLNPSLMIALSLPFLLLLGLVLKYRQALKVLSRQVAQRKAGGAAMPADGSALFPGSSASTSAGD